MQALVNQFSRPDNVVILGSEFDLIEGLYLLFVETVK